MYHCRCTEGAQIGRCSRGRCSRGRCNRGRCSRVLPMHGSCASSAAAALAPVPLEVGPTKKASTSLLWQPNYPLAHKQLSHASGFLCIVSLSLIQIDTAPGLLGYLGSMVSAYASSILLSSLNDRALHPRCALT